MVQCHKNLIIELGPKINFIVGHNGSGKSAVLLALTICLGSSANKTDRAARLKDFIRSGQSRATIKVTLNNVGPSSYNHEIYGDEITIERTFDAKSSSYKIRNFQGKVISHFRKDLDDILDTFNIIVDNPLAILQQDAARSFLATSSNTERYEFFSKGINHEVWKKLSGMIDYNADQAHMAIETLKEELKKTKEELKMANAQYQAFDQFHEKAREIVQLEKTISWKKVELKEEDIEDLQQQIEEMEQKIQDYEQGMPKLIEAEKKVNDKLEELASKKSISEEMKEEKDRQVEEAKQQCFESEQKLQRIKDTINELEQSTRRYQTSRQTVLDKIEEEERNIGGGYAEKRAEYTKSKTILEQELQKVCGAIDEAITSKSATEEELENLKSQKIDIQKRINNLNQTINEHRHTIETIKKADSNFYEAFGPSMISILQQIESAGSRFKSKPIGPVGSFITLKAPQWAPIFNALYGKTLSSFIVNNAEDRQLLLSIFHNNNYKGSVITSQYDKFNYEQNMPDRNKFTVAHDVLEFSNDHVKQVMIDYHRIEGTILFENRIQAEEVMKNRPSNVLNCIALISENQAVSIGSNVRGASGTTPLNGSYAALRMRTTGGASTLRACQEQLKESMREHETLLKEKIVKDRQYETVAKKADAMKKQMFSLNHRKSEITTELDKITDGLAQITDDQTLNDKLRNLQDQLSTIDETIKIYSSQHEEAQLEKVEYEQDVNDYKIILSKAEDEAEKEKSRIAEYEEKEQTLRQELTSYRADSNDCLSAVNKKKDEKQKLLDEMELKKNELSELTNAATERAEERIHTSFTMEELNSQYIKLGNEMKYIQNVTNSNTTFAQAVKRKAEAMKKYHDSREKLRVAKSVNEHLIVMQKERKKKYKSILDKTVSLVTETFANVLRERDFEGSLHIDHDSREMIIKATPSGRGVSSNKRNDSRMMLPSSSEDNEGRDTRTLSGGEKSFSQIALLLAVWSAMTCRIRGLDEFDVFMDEVNRKVSMKLMIDAVFSLDQGQTIFITPNNMADIKIDKRDVKIFKMADPERS